MKKALVLFLSLSYLLLSSGFNIYSHFCKGIVQERGLISSYNATGICPICFKKEQTKEKKKDCCKQETKLVKLSGKAQKTAFKSFSIKVWGDVIPNRTLGAVFDAQGSFTTQKATLTKTSPLPGNPLYILHCVYRI